MDLGNSRVMKPPRTRAHLTVLLLLVLPVLLMLFGFLPFRLRFAVLVALAAIAATLAIFRGYTRASLGLRFAGTPAMALWTTLPAIVLAAAVAVNLLEDRHELSLAVPFYLFFVFISAPAQEFLYRSFLFVELESAEYSTFTIMLVSAALYSFMHVIYYDTLTILITFVAGLLWSWLFMTYRSFPLVATSHAAAGALAIALGII